MDSFRLPLSLVLLAACGSSASFIAGTKIPDDDVNRAVLARCEEYRTAVEAGDAQKLVLLASPSYWEDSGTPTGSDDYGFEGLKNLLRTRFAEAKEIRFSMKYVGVRIACPAQGELVAGCRAHVEVLVDASFSLVDSRGQERRPDKRDQNELVLEWNGEKWMFIAGM